MLYATIGTMEPLDLLAEKKVGKTLRGMAREIGISAPYLQQVLKRERPPGPKILGYLGLEKLPISYRKLQRKRRNGK